ncbi:WD40 repeat-like protein [Dissoconium aciculare CBS 342.82]|uniref:Intraflagellar transport protein 122 homolog n=1 Tax=Dissoconium aciculare CBS 342.82 TaxID=1314786 RepID=A0A6J3LYJ3_9PEZI|nr:WD40 repeat-like protein [Dissoconium aciculare CBS 342.82]KAF1820840.1 WD40 repeat-like protein [Dissoconium aciculare CBS 342.82]
MVPPKPDVTLESAARYTVAWIAALAHERAAALMMLDERHNEPTDFTQNASDANSYSWGKVGRHNVVIASLPTGEYGLASAASTANHLCSSLPHIRVGLLVGIGAGIPTLDPTDASVYLGDVVVSNPDDTHGGVVQYDLYKASSSDGSSFRERKGFLDSPPRVLRTALNALQAEHEISSSGLEDYLVAFSTNEKTRERFGYPGSEKDRLRREHKQTRSLPSIHYGTIVSGNVLIKSTLERDAIVSWLLSTKVDPMCFEMEAAGLMNSFPCLIIRGICDYADEHKDDTWQRYSAATAAAFAKELLSYVRVKEVERTASILEVLGQIKQDVSSVRSDMRMHDSSLRFGLSFKVASGAKYDGDIDQENGLGYCLEGTRMEIIDLVDTWMNDPVSKRIFWLCGMAGTGKSTLSRTIAQRCKTQSRLGASFFFKRGEGDRNNARLFFPTIAKQLSDQIPEMREHILHALGENSGLCDGNLQEQCEKLVDSPLRSIDPSNLPNDRYIIIIDALDECEHDPSISMLLRLLSQASKGHRLPPFQIFVTSRPELPIRLGFKRLDESTHEDVILEQAQRPTIAGDIQLFFEQRVKEIRENYSDQDPYEQLPSDWPGASRLKRLVDSATPLFIFAFTVCRFIADGDPEEGLQSVIRERDRNSLLDFGPTYLPTLRRLLRRKSAKEKEKVLAQFQELIGAIVLLSEPLSAESLSILLQLNLRQMHELLKNMHPVLSIPKRKDRPIRLFHLSFAEFLTGDRTDNPFWVDKIEVHRRITRMCLDRLGRDGGLFKDMIEVEEPQTRRTSIDQSRIKGSISADVAYACSYWALHAVSGEQQMSDDDEIHKFLETHLLHWLEALSWLGRLSTAVSQINDLRKRAESDCCDKLAAFLRDARQFLIHSRYIIDLAPLQVYHSAIVFTPIQSIVRKTFHRETYATWAVLPEVRSQWSANFYKLEGHIDQIVAIAFSPDGQFLVSGSDDRSIRQWDSQTGEFVQKMEGHKDSVDAVAFSSDGHMIASASRDRSVRLWSTYTGELVLELKGHDSAINAVAFSPDGRSIASASGCMVLLWKTHSSTGAQTPQTREHESKVIAIAFSPDGRTLASVTQGNILSLHRTHEQTTKSVQRALGKPEGQITAKATFTPDMKLVALCYCRVQIFDVQTGDHILDLGGNGAFIDAVAFSLHPRYMIATTSNSLVQLWDGRSGELLRRFQEQDLICSIAFSPDGSVLATGSWGQTVRLWDCHLDEAEHNLAGHDESIEAVTVSRDERFVATASCDQTVKIWDMATRRPVHELRGHTDGVSAVAFSSDSTVLASASEDWTVRIWDTDTGSLAHELKGHEDCVNDVAFASHGGILASASDDRTVRIWNRDEGRLVYELKGHRAGVDAVTFALDGASVASAAEDWTVRIWSLQTGDLLQVIPYSELSAHHRLGTEGSLLQAEMGTFVLNDLRLRDIERTFMVKDSLALSDQWILHRGQELLWLPHDYRGHRRKSLRVSASQGKTLIIGQASGAGGKHGSVGFWIRKAREGDFTDNVQKARTGILRSRLKSAMSDATGTEYKGRMHVSNTQAKRSSIACLPRFRTTSLSIWKSKLAVKRKSR